MNATRQNQRGLALVVVLWVVASLALMVAAFNASVKSSAVMVASENAFAKEDALINSAVELAVAQLTIADKDFRWHTDGSAHVITFAGTQMRIKISDTNGRVDINKTADAVLLALLKRHASSPTQAEEIRDRILDWRDDDEKRREKGAEDLDYQRAGRSHGAGDTRFSDITQLRDVLGVSYDLYRKLLPFMTVHNRTGLINPLTASREVLLSLPNIKEADVDRIFVLRDQEKDNRTTVLNLLAKNRKWLNTSGGPAYDISVEVKDSHGKYGLPAITTILTGADELAPYRVLAWRR